MVHAVCHRIGRLDLGFCFGIKGGLNSTRWIRSAYGPLLPLTGVTLQSKSAGSRKTTACRAALRSHLNSSQLQRIGQKWTVAGIPVEPHYMIPFTPGCGLSHDRLKRKRPGSRGCCRATSESASLDEGMLTELPCLPFPYTDCFVPSSSTTLHLYEARFLALLDEAMSKTDNLFVHMLLVDSSAGVGPEGSSFVASNACLTRIENVRRLQIGALVTVRGVGRLTLVGLTQLEPFIRGRVMPLKDKANRDEAAVQVAVQELRAVLADVQQLQIKLKASGNELMQTQLDNALYWADHVEDDDDDEKRMSQQQLQGLVSGISYLPDQAERISFAAFQPYSGASMSERNKLMEQKLQALEMVDTLERLKIAKEFAQDNRAQLAAKVALQNLKF